MKRNLFRLLLSLLIVPLAICCSKDDEPGGKDDNSGNGNSNSGTEWEVCYMCHGNGWCYYCDGSGIEPVNGKNKCPMCHGDGECHHCWGKGKVEK